MSIVGNILGAFGRLIGRVLRRVIVPAAGACVVGYFAYYAVHGERGLMAMKRLQGQIASAEQSLAEVRSDRERMEQRVRLLRSDHLDRDMLDERAREMLNVARPEDVIVLMPPVAATPAAPAKP
jgi:cell division protein FtsB